tara:strand:- start:1493 stop:4093 length:2601 start_codon:yes stop_codon:yes gene_type:complete
MAKLGYTKRSRGGQYRQRSTGDDRQATAQEKRITDYLEKARQEQKTVRDEQLTDLRGVFSNEADNRDQLHKLENQLRNAQKDNTAIKRDRDVKRLEDEARQKQDEAEWWADFSPTLAENLEKAAKGAWDFVSATRDKGIIDKFKYEVAHEEYDKTFNNLVGDSLNDQTKLQREGDIDGSKELNREIESQRNQVLWSDKYTLQQADVIKQNWSIIVSEALGTLPIDQQTPELIEARLQQVKKQLGIGRGSVGDREINEFAKKKITAWSAFKNQQIKVANSDRDKESKWKHLFLIKENYDNADPETQKKLSLAMNDLCLAYNSSYEFSESGKFITPADRGINFGQACDSAVMDAMNLHIDKFRDFEDFKNILKGHILPGKEHEGKPYESYVYDLPSWEKQRSQKISFWKDEFVKKKRERRKVAAIHDKEAIDKLAIEWTDRLENKKNPEFLDANDYSIGGGRQQIWRAYHKTGQPEAVKNVLAEALAYDPKSTTLQATHDKLTRSTRDGDFVEFMDAYKFLTPSQQQHYQADFERLRILQGEGITPKAVEDVVTKELNALIQFNPLTKTKHSSFEGALESGRQLFYYHLSRTDLDDYKDRPGKLIFDVMNKTKEDIRDKEGLFRVQTLADAKGTEKNQSVFVNFDITPNEDKISKAYIKEKHLDGTYKTIRSLMENEQVFSEEETNTLADAILNGRDKIEIPENAYNILKEYYISGVAPDKQPAVEDVINAWFKYKGIPVTMPPQQRTLFRWRLEDKTIAQQYTSAYDVQAISAALDVRDAFGEMPMNNIVKTYKEVGDEDELLHAYGLETQNFIMLVDENDNYVLSDPEKAIKSGRDVIRYNPYTNTFTKRESLKDEFQIQRVNNND